MTPTGSRFGQLERPPGGVAGVGQAAGRLLRVGQQVEHAGGLGRPAGEDQGVRTTRQTRFVARSEAQGRGECDQRLFDAIEPEQDPAQARMGQRPVGRQRGSLGVGGHGGLMPTTHGRDMAVA